VIDEPVVDDDILFGDRAEWNGVSMMPSKNSPHVITMTFDMTDPDGRSAFENARQGLDRGLVLETLAEEMRQVTKYGHGISNAAKEVKYREGIEIATHHWRERLYALMDKYGVTEVE
jgi:hypothetical protein